ncbi:MAG: hypothetical protein GY945_07510 [Rhodobacteraceae bacterium]|nr:hypothetical protein [Paracoccaceae bacterium]
MKKAFLSTLAAITLMGSSAQADLASFERAFTGICLGSLPDLRSAPALFKSEGWDGYAGADPGEYEFYKGGTSVFLAASQQGGQPGCTVMDDALARVQALWLMELWLNKHHQGSWKQGTDEYGPVWRLLLEEGTIVFHLADDPNGEGGASVSFELRQ